MKHIGMMNTSTIFAILNVYIFTPLLFSNSFIVAPTIKINTSTNSFLLSASATSTSTDSSSSKSKNNNTTRNKRAKSVTDRTQEETLSLIQDVVEATLEAGTKGGLARTFQAYRAVTTTVLDFLPPPPMPLPGLGSFNRNKKNKQPETFSAPVALRKLFERMGATYIKIGQFVASSPTLFPEEYVLEFQKCLDQTEPLPWSTVKKVIEDELGPISKTFEFIDQTPLASASIAQVHKALLKTTGETVAVKVQKPNIEFSLKADLSFIYVASRILEFIQPDFERTSLSAIASDVRTSMLEELDFLKEAANVKTFRLFLKDQNLINVATAPRIYDEYTTKKVMTMEFLKGVSFLDPESISSNSNVINGSPELTIVTALNVWTQSVLTMPFFHADVHAGNLLSLEDGRIGFIDFGIVGKISPAIFEAVTDLSGALSEADYEGMAQALCKMGATDESVDIQKFGQDIEQILRSLNDVQPDLMVQLDVQGNMEGAGVLVGEKEVTQVLLNIVKVTEDNGLKLPREFGLLVKQSLYFERYLKILAPSLDVMSDERVIGFNNNSFNARPSDVLKTRSDENIVDGIIDVELQ